MKQINFDYSLTNVSTPINKPYFKRSQIKWRYLYKEYWKAYFFEFGKSDEYRNLVNYRFKTNVTSPQNKHSSTFENNLCEWYVLLNLNIEKHFEKHLKADTKKFKETKLLKENINNTYQKFNKAKLRKIKIDAKSIREALKT